MSGPTFIFSFGDTVMYSIKCHNYIFGDETYIQFCWEKTTGTKSCVLTGEPSCPESPFVPFFPLSPGGPIGPSGPLGPVQRNMCES